MGKTFTRSIGAGFALAIAAATFSPALANAADTGEVSVPRVAEIAEAQAADNGIGAVSMVAAEDADGEFTEAIAVTVKNLLEAPVVTDGPVDWHCFAYVNDKGDIPEDLAAEFESRSNGIGGLSEVVPGNLLSTAGWANNHAGPSDHPQNLDTTDLEDGTYTVASVCMQGVTTSGDGETTQLGGTQDFTLSTPAEGSLGDLDMGSLGGSDSLGGGSAGDTGSMAAVGSLVLGGGVAGAIHAHNIGLI